MTLAQMGDHYYEKRQDTLNQDVSGGKKCIVRQNVWGNWRGYVGGKRAIELRDSDEAKQWLAAQGCSK
jgi:hypothetical protein